MRRLLRSLEKKLVLERTELAVVPLVHDLLSRWEDALSDHRPAPDLLDFVVGLIESGYCLTTGSKAFTYLDRCQRKGSLPDEGRLIQILMPWRTSVFERIDRLHLDAQVFTKFKRVVVRSVVQRRAKGLAIATQTLYRKSPSWGWTVSVVGAGLVVRRY